MFSRQHQLLAVAVMAALSLSACGKKTDLVSNAPPPAPKAEEKKSPETTLQAQNPGLGGGLEEGTAELPETPGKKTPKAPNLGGADLPPPPSLPKAPARPQPQQPGPQGNGQAEQQRPPQIRPGTVPQVADVQPAPDMNSVDRLDTYQPDDRSNLSRNLTKRLTGGRTQDGLLYTSSSTDTVHESLRARNEKVDFNSRRLNLAASAAVTSAGISVDSMSGEAVVTVKFQEARGEQVYKLSGAMGGNLRSVRSGSTGSQPIDGSLQCLDFDRDQGGACENIFARIRVGSVGSSAIVNVVFRQSLADLFFDLPGEHSENPEYLSLRGMIVNSIQSASTRNKIFRTVLNTWEVTNGRSGFTVLTTTGTNELLGYSGALLAPEVGTGVSVPLSRVTSDGDDDSRLNFASMISEAKLIANNGLGQIRLLLKMRSRGNFKQDQFAMTVARKVKPTIDPNSL